MPAVKKRSPANPHKNLHNLEGITEGSGELDGHIKSTKTPMFEKIKSFLDSQNFLKYALLSSLVLAFASLAVAFYFAVKVQMLTRAVLAHEQVLVKITTGEMPVLKVGEQTIPFSAFIYNQVNELTKRVKALEPATSPSPTPNRFELPK